MTNTASEMFETGGSLSSSSSEDSGDDDEENEDEDAGINNDEGDNQSAINNSEGNDQSGYEDGEQASVQPPTPTAPTSNLRRSGRNANRKRPTYRLKWPDLA